MSDLIDRNEVIEIIESVCSADDSYWQPGTLEKIRNLPTHPTPSNTLGALDCVDRAEAIKAVKFYETFYDPYPRVIEALEELPSVQSEQELLKDGTLVVKTDFDMTKFNRVNVIQNGTHYGDLFYQDDDTRRKGKWIRWHETLEDASGVEYMPRCKCSECGKEYEAHSTRFINFCPNCGADMREGDAE